MARVEKPLVRSSVASGSVMAGCYTERPRRRRAARAVIAPARPWAAPGGPAGRPVPVPPGLGGRAAPLGHDPVPALALGRYIAYRRRS